MHSKGIVHRRINSSNIHVENTSDSLNFLVKLDGLEEAFVRVNAYDRVTGSLKHTTFDAPDTYEESYTEKVDVWSIGMLFYFLLTGSMPFSEEEFRKVCLTP